MLFFTVLTFLFGCNSENQMNIEKHGGDATNKDFTKNNEAVKKNKELKKDYIVERGENNSEILYVLLGDEKIKIKEGIFLFKNVDFFGDIVSFENGRIPSSSGRGKYFYSISKGKIIAESMRGMLTKGEEDFFFCDVDGDNYSVVSNFHIKTEEKKEFREEGKYVNFCHYDKENNRLLFSFTDEIETINKIYDFEIGKLEILDGGYSAKYMKNLLWDEFKEELEIGNILEELK